MNVVLSIEAIHPPLAGIGRYAWELATRLPLQQEIESVRYLSDGQWRDLPNTNLVEPASPNVELTSDTDKTVLNFKGRMRKRLEQFPHKLRRRIGQVPLFARAYGKIMPLLASNNLDGVKNAVFHGPNYFVPKTHLPSVVTIHDLSIYRYPQWHPKARIERMQMAIPEAIERASLILAISESTRRDIIDQFQIPAERVQVTLLGVDQNYHPRTSIELAPVLSKFGLSMNAYSFFVSTIEPRKNLTNLIAAYRLLPIAMRQRWPLVLVGGGGWQSEDIHADIQRAVGEGWLKYLGFVDQADLPVLYAGARLFTYPSWYEGFGLPIAEAMASGVPVLTSNCSSMPEVAAGAARLVEPGDVDSIREGLAQALDDDAWRELAVQRGLQRATELSWDACVRNTIAAYQRVSNK
ncbi:glycosyltransferase family 4 protein [Undibacterium sp. BYS107W]|uniref:Glycosyltransferase family 4 protein n=1 Tax=Undibacterium baiyunense TaxID=2828731 RepID=A0A941I3E1_9BURK|nr:glycosyltransferase family 4 protein [Undibacterium baiyunense]